MEALTRMAETSCRFTIHHSARDGGEDKRVALIHGGDEMRLELKNLALSRPLHGLGEEFLTKVLLGNPVSDCKNLEVTCICP
jgi:hypothetical protein